MFIFQTHTQNSLDVFKTSRQFAAERSLRRLFLWLAKSYRTAMAEDKAMTEHRGYVAVFLAVLLANAAAEQSCSVERYEEIFTRLNCRAVAGWEALRHELQEKTKQYKPSTIVIDCEHRSVYNLFLLIVFFTYFLSCTFCTNIITCLHSFPSCS